MSGRGFRHWMPRLVVLASVAALALPTPSYVARLTRDELVLWWADVLWVLLLPTAFVAVLLGVHRLRRSANRSSTARDGG